jgi:hypothetical protein
MQDWSFDSHFHIKYLKIIKIFRFEFKIVAYIDKYDVELRVFGLVSSSKIVPLIHHLNKPLWHKFLPDPYNALSSSEKGFVKYNLCNDVDLGKCFFIDNKSDIGFFYKELKNFDYLFINIDNQMEELLTDITLNLKKLPKVQTCIEVDAEKLKHTNLLYLYQQNLMSY